MLKQPPSRNTLIISNLTLFATQMRLLYFPAGVCQSAFFPNFISTDMQSDFKQMTASFVTSLKPSFLTKCKSPLEAPSAILLKELTRDIQHIVAHVFQFQQKHQKWHRQLDCLIFHVSDWIWCLRCQRRGSSSCWPLHLTTSCKQEQHIAFVSKIFCL